MDLKIWSKILKLSGLDTNEKQSQGFDLIVLPPIFSLIILLEFLEDSDWRLILI